MCIKLEYCPGGTLQTALQSGLSVEEVRLHLQELATGFLYLANCKPPIIHRDFKPANAMFNENRRCVIIDFGVAPRTASASQNTLATVR